MATSMITCAQATSPWLPYSALNPGANLRMFCFPYAGGGASVFHAWSGALTPRVEVCPVQLPGREHWMKQRPFTSLPELVRSVFDALVPHMDAPFVLFGHSMGALLAFELVRFLRREGAPQPRHIIVSGCRAPHVAEPERITYNLPEPELLEELRTLNGTPAGVLENPELMEILLPILRADFEIVETYEYSPEEPLSCPISVFGGLHDEKVEHRHLEAWREHTTSACSIRMLPGDHFFVRTAQADLLRLIDLKLAAVLGSIAARKERL